MEAKRLEMTVMKTSIMMFVNHVEGQVVPKLECDIKQYVNFIPMEGSFASREVTLVVTLPNDNQYYNFKISPKLLGAALYKIDGKSQWDLFCEAVDRAGIGWKIVLPVGIIDGNDIKSSDGTELDWGFRRIKLINQEGLEFDLLSGRIDEEVFGAKFSFLKGLPKEVADIKHSGLNSTIGIQVRKKAVEPFKRSKPDRTRKTGSGGATI